MTEEQLNEIIVELQHVIRGLRHEAAGHRAAANNWKELYDREKRDNRDLRLAVRDLGG